jgi:hypothetical protein
MLPQDLRAPDIDRNITQSSVLPLQLFRFNITKLISYDQYQRADVKESQKGLLGAFATSLFQDWRNFWAASRRTYGDICKFEFPDYTMLPRAA